MRFSVFNLARQALSAHRNWPEQWRSPEPKNAYDAIIIGAGGHGLGTAYYLAKEHGMRNIAVLEKGWLGGGNTGTFDVVGSSLVLTIVPEPTTTLGLIASGVAGLFAARRGRRRNG